MNKVGANDKMPASGGSAMGKAIRCMEGISTWNEHKIEPESLASRLKTSV